MYYSTRLRIRRQYAALEYALRLAYWRQIVRLARFAAGVRASLDPIRGYLWLPVVAGMAGIIVGILITVA